MTLDKDSGDITLDGTVAEVNVTNDELNAAIKAVDTALPANCVLVAGDDGTNAVPLQIDGSGQLKTDASSNLDDCITTLDGALPTKNVLVCGDDGTDTAPLQLDASGQLKVNPAALDSSTDSVTVVATTTATTPTQGGINIDAGGTPQQVIVASTSFQTCTLIGNKGTGDAVTETPNGANVNIGFASGAGLQPIVIQPGEIFTITAPPNQSYDLNDLYVDGTTNDGLVYIYS